MVFCVLFNLIILHLFIIVNSFFKIILNLFNDLQTIKLLHLIISLSMLYFIFCIVKWPFLEHQEHLEHHRTPIFALCIYFFLYFTILVIYYIIYYYIIIVL